jgi:hypothetical protein
VSDGVIDNAVLRQSIAFLSTTKGRKRRRHQHLCLERAYNSTSAKQAMTKRGYVPHMPCKIKRVQKIESRKQGQCATRNVLMQKTSEGVWIEQTHGTTGSENYSQGMNRKQRATLFWFSYHAVSSST